MAITHVDGVNLGSAVLQSAIRKATGGGANIGHNLALHANGKNLQRLGQLEAAAAHIGQLIAQQANLHIGSDRRTGLIYFLLVH